MSDARESVEHIPVCRSHPEVDDPEQGKGITVLMEEVSVRVKRTASVRRMEGTGGGVAVGYEFYGEHKGSECVTSR